jgi:hypothetical protein
MNQLNINPKVAKMSEVKGIKSLVGRKMTKSVKFLDDTVIISKLSVDDVMEVQTLAKEIEESKNENAGIEILKLVISKAVEGGSELTEEDFNSFPMDELSKLANDIMKFSGMTTEAAGK